MSEFAPLIELLVEPGIHSGTELGNQLGISRVAIKKRIDRLAATGFPVETVSGRGYMLSDAAELLSETKIKEALQFMGSNSHAGCVSVFQNLESTNKELAKMPAKLGQVNAVLSEAQHRGQGRRGRSWVSTPYKNLMLSVGYTYPSWPDNPSAVSLAFSVAVHRALLSQGVNEIKLKWPNDLVAEHPEHSGIAKLGGLLVSATGEAGGELNLILGVGINMHVGEMVLAEIDQSAIDLVCLGYSDVSRNVLAADIISNTAEMLNLYPQTGFQPFADYWNNHAVFVGEQIRLFDQNQEFVGELQGVNEMGELCLLDKQGVLTTFNRSELSMRSI